MCKFRMPKTGNPANPGTAATTLLGALITSRAWIGTLLVLTLFSVFAYDARLACGKDADTGFLSATVIVLAAFILEIVVLCIALERYFELPCQVRQSGGSSRSRWSVMLELISFGSFQFWLDVASALSLVFEIWLIFGEVGTYALSSRRSSLSYLLDELLVYRTRLTYPTLLTPHL
jgi:hypothetical protein